MLLIKGPKCFQLELKKKSLLCPRKPYVMSPTSFDIHLFLDNSVPASSSNTLGFFLLQELRRNWFSARTLPHVLSSA